MTVIEAKLDVVINKLGNNERRMHTTLEVGALEERERRKSVEEGQDHEGSYQVEEEQYLNANRSYTFKLNLNLPTHYTPALKNHENFSYGGEAQQRQRLGQNMQQYHASLRFQQQQQQQQQARHKVDNQGQRRSNSFEDQMLTFMGENKRLLNIHGQKFAELAAFQANTTMFQANINASLKNLETQVGQLALGM